MTPKDEGKCAAELKKLSRALGVHIIEGLLSDEEVLAHSNYDFHVQMLNDFGVHSEDFNKLDWRNT